MAQDEENRNPDPDSPAPEPAPADTARPEPEQKPVVHPDPPPRTFGISRKPKKEKKSSGLWGILFFFLLIVAGGVAGGGYYLYQEQIKFQNEARAKFSQQDADLNALDTEADLTRQNQQSIDALNQDLKQFKIDMTATLKAHQNSLTTLDEDVLRLKEKVGEKTEAPPVPPSLIDGIDTTPGSVPGEAPPESPDEELPEGGLTGEDEPTDESQRFVDWMENFFAAIWNWLAGLFS